LPVSGSESDRLSQTQRVTAYQRALSGDIVRGIGMEARLEKKQGCPKGPPTDIV